MRKSIKQRVYLWDNMKVVLMILVVITHSVNIYQLNGERWIQFLWIPIMTFTMPAFMMISGYWYKERTLSYAVSHYLYPWMLFSVVNYAIGSLCGHYPPQSQLLASPPLKSAWAMWYIWALFVYSIITPRLLKVTGINKLIFLSFLICFVGGFKFLPNDILDAQRVLNFYPFYLIGYWLKQNNQVTNSNNIKFKKWSICFIFCLVAYYVLTYRFAGFCYGTGFMSSHGLSLYGFACRWTNYFLCVLMSVSLIMIAPRKKLCFTKYGTRTMNVYMLHMTIIFVLSFYLCKPVMHEWYAYVSCLLLTPSLCLLLFSKKVDAFMRPILDFSKKIIK